MKDNDMKTAKDSEDDFFLDPELHAYVDGKLSPERAAMMEARLSGDPDRRDVVEGWSQVREMIRDAAEGADDEPIDLRTELLARELSSRVRSSRRRNLFVGPAMRQLVASIALFAAGWTGHAIFATGGLPTMSAEPVHLVQTATQSPNSRTIIDVLNPLDDRMQNSLHWLSVTAQRPVGYPSLAELGLTLRGGQIIDGRTGPAIQLLYEADNDKLVTVTMMPHPTRVPDYPYEVRSIAGSSMAYMTREGVDYAITGEDDPVRLATMASALQ